MVDVKDTLGLWERSLIAWPDGREDRTTFVAWLQGPSLFADLRQPADAPSFERVACLDDLAPEQLGWLARQEGFAGHFARSGEAFEWRRAIDFQCTSDAADAGYLAFTDGVLIERGRDIPYIEHWHHKSQMLDPQFAVRMVDESGVGGFLVRVGDLFMYVRDRAVQLPHGGSLSELVSGATVDEARALLDCEISLGRLTGGSWTIERSSLPFRRCADLGFALSDDENTIIVRDLAANGAPISRRWTILDFEGDLQQKRMPGQDYDEGALSAVRSMIGRAR